MMFHFKRLLILVLLLLASAKMHCLVYVMFVTSITYPVLSYLLMVLFPFVSEGMFHFPCRWSMNKFSLKTKGRRFTMNVDNTFRPPLIPIWAVSPVILPPHSTVDVYVSSPIVSLSSPFIPTVTFCEHPHLSTQQKNVTIERHVSSLSVTNHSPCPQTIPPHYCFGYLHSPPLSNTFSARISGLCQKYNERKNNQIRDSSLTTQLSPRASSVTSSRNKLSLSHPLGACTLKKKSG